MAQLEISETTLPRRISSINSSKTITAMKSFGTAKRTLAPKPDKFGMKVWLLTDADTYYVPRFQVYLGKDRMNSELVSGTV